jgi:RNA polymerase sigma factor (sigma-70 family)
LFPVSRRGGNIPVETMSEPDSSLIAEFNARRSEDAFAALVRQHVNLVFATALRQVGDAGAAEEITQNVFVALAQAAGKLGSHPTIAGWLHQTALNKSREWLRSELRRRKREQVAVSLDLARAEGDSVWSPLVPLLDEALLELRGPDRQAVILHFMEGRTFQEVGFVLGVGEDTARKRVHRCLDQLTHYFRRHGFAAPALAAGTPLFTLSSHAAPVGLAASATTAGLTAAHSAASTSTLTLIKGALKIMAWTKMKTVIVTGVVILLAATVTPYVWYYHLAPASWQHRLEATYRLRNGEVVRHISPPYIPERLTYYRTENPGQAKEIPAGPDCWVFIQDKQGQLRDGGETFGSKQFPLQLVLRTAFRFEKYEFEGPNNLLDLPVNGDWTISENLNHEALLAALEPILLKITKHHIKFVKKTVEREVIVVSGDHLAIQPGKDIQVYAENSQDKEYDGYGDLNNLFEEVGNRLNIRFINETQIDSKAPETRNLIWEWHRDSDVLHMKNRRIELTDKLLKNLADQTGFTFTREQRPVEVWFVTEQR